MNFGSVNGALRRSTGALRRLVEVAWMVSASCASRRAVWRVALVTKSLHRRVRIDACCANSCGASRIFICSSRALRR
ncbi:hypothetical protein A2U01_0080947, partial [Trifolium medium]|nr:hypothetical protein [Trifolium medium]